MAGTEDPLRQSQIKSVSVDLGRDDDETCSVAIESTDATVYTIHLRRPNAAVAAAVNEVASIMRSTAAPLIDVEAVIDRLGLMLNSYERLSPLPTNIRDTLREIDSSLREGREHLGRAAAVPSDELAGSDARRTEKAAHVDTVLTCLMKGVNNFAGILGSLAVGNPWVTAALADEQIRYLESVVVICNLWKTAFHLGLFR